MKDNMIVFDSNDWASIRDTIKKIDEIGCAQVGKTQEGESITFDVGRDEDGNDYLITEVLQRNGWVRVNNYYPADYYFDETYRRG